MGKIGIKDARISVFLITPNSRSQVIEPCEMWDPQHVWSCW